MDKVSPTLKSQLVQWFKRKPLSFRRKPLEYWISLHVKFDSKRLKGKRLLSQVMHHFIISCQLLSNKSKGVFFFRLKFRIKASPNLLPNLILLRCRVSTELVTVRCLSQRFHSTKKRLCVMQNTWDNWESGNLLEPAEGGFRISQIHWYDVEDLKQPVLNTNAKKHVLLKPNRCHP